MLTERGLRVAVDNFFTLFLIVATVSLPLHLIHGIVFWDAIAADEIHPQIRRLSEGIEVKGVSPDDLTAASLGLVVVAAAELLFVPVLVKATARVVEVGERGGVPTVVDAWRAVGRDRLAWRAARADAWPLVTALAVALALGWLVDRAGMAAIDAAGAHEAVPAVAAVRALGRAVGAPFFVATAAVVARAAKGRRVAAPTLY